VGVLTVGLLWRKLFEPCLEVGVESGFVVIDKNTGRYVHGVHQAEAFSDTGFLHSVRHIGRDVGQLPAPVRLEPKFLSV
jgi:hypothetical protein